MLFARNHMKRHSSTGELSADADMTKQADKNEQ